MLNNLSYGMLIVLVAALALWAWDHGFFDFLKGGRYSDDLNDPAGKRSGRE